MNVRSNRQRQPSKAVWPCESVSVCVSGQKGTLLCATPPDQQARGTNLAVQFLRKAQTNWQSSSVRHDIIEHEPPGPPQQPLTFISQSRLTLGASRGPLQSDVQLLERHYARVAITASKQYVAHKHTTPPSPTSYCAITHQSDTNHKHTPIYTVIVVSYSPPKAFFILIIHQLYGAANVESETASNEQTAREINELLLVMAADPSCSTGTLLHRSPTQATHSSDP